MPSIFTWASTSSPFSSPHIHVLNTADNGKVICLETIKRSHHCLPLHCTSFTLCLSLGTLMLSHCPLSKGRNPYHDSVLALSVHPVSFHDLHLTGSQYDSWTVPSMLQAPSSEPLLSLTPPLPSHSLPFARESLSQGNLTWPPKVHMPFCSTRPFSSVLLS